MNRREYTEDGKSMIDCEFASGERYIGGYENGNWNGQGTYIYADGDRYVGEFKDNKKYGHGTFIWADGAKYIGEFKDDNRWNGVFYRPDGTVKGTYSNGEWIAK